MAAGAGPAGSASHNDKQATEVLDDDDLPTTVEALKLGMQVEIKATAVNRNSAVGQAARIAFGQWVARAIQGDRRFVADGKAVDIESIVTQFRPSAAFKLFGLHVDASKAEFVN